MSDLTAMQRILRPVLNYLVERFFPRGAFYGSDYMSNLRTDTANLRDKFGSTEMACALFITSSLRQSGAEHAVFEASNVEENGIPVGSWKMTVEKIEGERNE